MAFRFGPGYNRAMPAPVDHDEKRSEIARIAADLIAERGLEAATIRQVAARAGFSTTVVTHYFANKRAMLLAAYSHMAQSTEARYEGLVDAYAADPLARLEIMLPIDDEGLRAWRVYFQFWPMAANDAELQEEQRWWTDHAKELARAALAAAQPGIADIDLKATLAVVALQGIAVQALFDPANWPASRQREVWRVQARQLIGPN